MQLASSGQVALQDKEKLQHEQQLHFFISLIVRSMDKQTRSLENLYDSLAIAKLLTQELSISSFSRIDPGRVQFGASLSRKSPSILLFFTICNHNKHTGASVKQIYSPSYFTVTLNVVKMDDKANLDNQSFGRQVCMLDIQPYQTLN